MATIDVEDETILTAIFKDSFPEHWRENPDFALYLSELSSYGVEKLSHEPERLAEDRAQILKETQDLAFHNYKTFIETAECSREIFKDFSKVEQHVSSLLEKLPVLADKCNKFTKDSQEINASRKMNSVTLSKHPQLLEILEIPQLMDTCVRNGYYEEALELAAYVKRLEKKHSNIPVVIGIVNEVRNSSQLMFNQLIQQLRTNIQLPVCLRVIGYLRRMDVLTEPELRIKFLQARDAWFQSILGAIPTDDAYFHITKVIEASRVHLFDIITQYRAIFSDDDPILSTNHDSKITESAIFHGWVVEKVSSFMRTLEADLEKGVGSRLDSLLGQCMYFGLSFSRVGVDFRGLLAPLFQRAALKTFETEVRDAAGRFEESMQSYTIIGTPASLSSTVLSTNYSATEGNLAPPMVLMDYQPLALYTNNILTAFNDLRLCAPIALAEDVARRLQDSMSRMISSILAFHRAEESTFTKREVELFSKFCQVTVQEMVPYLCRCLRALFPPASVAEALGVSIAELGKMGNIGSINASDVIASLEPLLPEEEPPPPPPPPVSPPMSPAEVKEGDPQGKEEKDEKSGEGGKDEGDEENASEKNDSEADKSSKDGDAQEGALEDVSENAESKDESDETMGKDAGDEALEEKEETGDTAGEKSDDTEVTEETPPSEDFKVASDS
ncbi:conserved oligomeric Golgi complex subunit 8-like [Ptychodera flava]|uniref:conserved oligomeric Golgi complex subunit 8-like n=1 Tax=Ptychodera flava TaxID=63121 RepID=UPI003969BF5C